MYISLLFAAFLAAMCEVNVREDWRINTNFISISFHVVYLFYFINFDFLFINFFKKINWNKKRHSLTLCKTLNNPEESPQNKILTETKKKFNKKHQKKNKTIENWSWIHIHPPIVNRIPKPYIFIWKREKKRHIHFINIPLLVLNIWLDLKFKIIIFSKFLFL